MKLIATSSLMCTSLLLVYDYINIFLLYSFSVVWVEKRESLPHRSDPKTFTVNMVMKLKEF